MLGDAPLRGAIRRFTRTGTGASHGTLIGDRAISSDPTTRLSSLCAVVARYPRRNASVDTAAIARDASVSSYRRLTGRELKTREANGPRPDVIDALIVSTNGLLFELSIPDRFTQSANVTRLPRASSRLRDVIGNNGIRARARVYVCVCAHTRVRFNYLNVESSFRLEERSLNFPV